MKNLLILIFIVNTLTINAQSYESTYKIKGIVTNKAITQNNPIVWGQLRTSNSSDVLIKQKTDGTFYIKMTVNGKFGYGGYFKFLGKENEEYKYLRTDGTANDILLLNKPLGDVAKNNSNENNIILKMISYESSYGLMIKF